MVKSTPVTTETASEIARALNIQGQCNPVAKKRETKSQQKTLDWVRQGTCISCSVMNRKQKTPSQAHHQQMNGTKGPDDESLPLCLMCHDEFHSQGKESFYQKYGNHLELLATDRSKRKRP